MANHKLIDQSIRNGHIDVDAIVSNFAWDNGEGICIACGEPAYGVEPDAENYKCDACGKRHVIGMENLLIYLVP